jgi:hypothetical protein
LWNGWFNGPWGSLTVGDAELTAFGSTVGLWMFYKQHLCQSTAYVLDLCTTQYTVFHVCNIVCVSLLEIISPAWSNGNLM